eukprot:TRINITY_DN612_c0_g2_i8.p1 TRINITY_DN612_c0_g2~~TRINITY_DN612_c0_g2_i8.p1  ORF type:complete len:117 (-),score=49.59 TRINITY_DN612_c0_g2_i8:268-597(-)
MIRRPPRSTQSRSSAASDVYKRQVLEEGFEISALEMYKLNKTTAEEFFDVYKEVLPEYTPIVEHIITGPVVVMEVRQENVVQALRNLVGPNDPEIARQLRPNTIRQVGI